MLLLSQHGSLKIGETTRYTVTYTPARDTILPVPATLHLRIRNTSAIALRAAFVHGPYTIYVSAAPAAFDEAVPWTAGRTHGFPEFEANLKAGGSWATALKVPERVRDVEAARDKPGTGPPRDPTAESSVTWVIEVSSQVIFSNSATVHYELLIGRDEKSVHMGSSLLGGLTTQQSSNTGDASSAGASGSSGAQGAAHGSQGHGQLVDLQQSKGAKDGHHTAQPKGVYSRAFKVVVNDTASLWNTPKMPEWDDNASKHAAQGHDAGAAADKMDTHASHDEHKATKTSGKPRKRKNVHLVVLTHGLHSNLGADLLYLKESIDAAAKKARDNRRRVRAERRHPDIMPGSGLGLPEALRKAGAGDESASTAPTPDPSQTPDTNSDDEEEVIVRGFSGNAVRTERGIKYLGKRLAKFVLTMTYPDQPYRPITKKNAASTLSHGVKPEKLSSNSTTPSHRDSTIVKDHHLHADDLAYKITSISFIAHSLGGLVQTYAVAYIQKHSPTFFDHIKPINFIALASPFLGLSNENPLYVKFALDFGLVGRTGQDLGLTWRAPTLARSGWGALVGGMGESAQKRHDGPPEAKPLLRILPTGPAHTVLSKFRNRTLYSNVVNDGVVPLRTSCLLFLDWQGLGKVEKARRDNGLVGTVLEWGWAEVTGQNSSSPDRRNGSWSISASDENGKSIDPYGDEVPQPGADVMEKDDDARSVRMPKRPASARTSIDANTNSSATSTSNTTTTNTGPLSSLISFFKPNGGSTNQPSIPKSHRIYSRSQTLKVAPDDTSWQIPDPSMVDTASPTETRGRSTATSEDPPRASAPPKTTFFEAAGDLLKPPIPNLEFLITPASRPQTIFHDRLYQPSDIPPPPLKKRTASAMKKARQASQSAPASVANSPSSPSPHIGFPTVDTGLSSRDYDDTANTGPNKEKDEMIDGSAMKVEEKIARAYHRDLSWRKVLVSLQPDAHNNIVVRRKFANAYGWPVVQHLCDTHFGYYPEQDAKYSGLGLGIPQQRSTEPVLSTGGKATTSDHPPSIDQDYHAIARTRSESREARDQVPELNHILQNDDGGVSKSTLFLSPTSITSPSGGSSMAKALAGSHSSGSGSSMNKRPSVDRADSVGGWSDRDWLDSEIDSEDEAGQQAASGGAGWTWTEAIAGKGAGAAASLLGGGPLDLGFLTHAGQEETGKETERTPSRSRSRTREQAGQAQSRRERSAERIRSIGRSRERSRDRERTRLEGMAAQRGRSTSEKRSDPAGEVTAEQITESAVEEDK